MEKIINGINVYFFGDPKKQAIIFIHGFPFDHTMWTNQIESLQNIFFCVAYDIRGFGKSETGEGQYTMESYVEDLFAIIKALKIPFPIICGLSMGGYIAFRALEVEQNIFSGAIFCDTKPDADTDEIKINRANIIKNINSEGLNKFVDGFVPQCFSETTIKNNIKIYESIISKSKQNNPKGVKGALLAMLSRTSSNNFLKYINIPTLVVVGNDDKLTTPSIMKNFSEKIENSIFKIVPDSGHLSPLENPTYFNRIITEFIYNI